MVYIYLHQPEFLKAMRRKHQRSKSETMLIDFASSKSFSSLSVLDFFLIFLIHGFINMIYPEKKYDNLKNFFLRINLFTSICVNRSFKKRWEGNMRDQNRKKKLIDIESRKRFSSLSSLDLFFFSLHGFTNMVQPEKILTF